MEHRGSLSMHQKDWSKSEIRYWIKPFSQIISQLYIQICNTILTYNPDLTYIAYTYICAHSCVIVLYTETVDDAISNNGSVRTGPGSGKANIVVATPTPNSETFRNTFTGLASALILPQVTASSGLAPESEPSASWAVFTYTAKSAPFLYRNINQHYKLNRTEFDLIFMVSSIHWQTGLVLIAVYP